MKAIYATDFNDNLIQQNYQLEDTEEKINRLKNHGYKEVWISDEINGNSETIILNDNNGKSLYKVTYLYGESIKVCGVVKIKHRTSHIYVYAENEEDIVKHINIFKCYACKNPNNFSIMNIEVVDNMEKRIPCLVCV